MPRPRQNSLDRERYIARVTLRARRRRIQWKVIMAHFGLGRTKLNQLVAEYLAEKNVREHLGAGQLRIARGYGGRNQAIG